MLKHTKIYTEYFGICKDEHHYCEVCGRPATGGIHHIKRRGMGGSDQDYIENLAALCQKHHQMCEDFMPCNMLVKSIHERFMKMNPYNHQEFSDKLFSSNLRTMNEIWQQR